MRSRFRQLVLSNDKLSQFSASRPIIDTLELVLFHVKNPKTHKLVSTNNSGDVS